MIRQFYAHQKQAFRYTLDAEHPALFLEMRLGKTLVAVRRAKLYRPHNPALGLRVLVAAPSSALGSWEREAETEGAAVSWLTGAKKKRRAALESLFSQEDGPHAVFALINREGWIALPEISEKPWDAVILDESPFIKNPRARVTKFFLRHFRSVPHRWALTGTPNPEGEENYFCQLAWLWGSALGCKNYWQFRQRFMRPHPCGWGWTMRPGASDVVRREVGRRCIVMRRRDVGVERRKVFERRDIEFPAELWQTYATAEDDFILRWQEEEDRTFCAAAVWQWLRQLAGGFIEGRLVWPGKIQELLELALGELSRERFVVWCCYTAEVCAIRDALDNAGCPALSMQGEDSLEERERKRKDFAAGRVRALVLQQAVAQTGMDLSAADTAIYFSTPPGQLARVQTEDRILSLQKGGPLLYLDLVTKGTVDEDVLKTLQDKERLTQASLSRALAVAMRERKAWTR